ncbi:MAG: uroporphyrinogen-III synthase [Gemmatimonadota bacterium]
MGDRPLLGRRIVVTRSAQQSAGLLETLRALGAIPVAAPAIRLLPPEDRTPLFEAVRHLDSFDWLVCTSGNAVSALNEARLSLGLVWPARLRIAAVGAGTARALEDVGAQVAFVPTRALGEVLGRELPIASGESVLWPHGDLAGPAMLDGLLARKAMVTAPIAYRTVSDAGSLGVVEILRDGHIDAITFTSGSTVRHVAEGLSAAGIGLDSLDAGTRPLIVCIGPVTAEAARSAGLPVDAVAATHDDAGLVDALLRSLTPRSMAV